MTHILENGHLRVKLDAATGGIAAIHDTFTATDYLSAAGPEPIFRVVAPKGDVVSHVIAAAEGELTGSGSEAVWHGRVDGVEGRVTYRLDGPVLEMGLELVNGSALTIEEVQFPVVSGLVPLDGARIVAPSLSRRTINDPFGKDLGGDHRIAYDLMQKRVYRYPHKMTTTWLDYGNAQKGLALESRGTDFSICDFYVYKRVEKKPHPLRRSLEMGIAYPHRIAPGGRWIAAPARVVAHEGDWHAVADAHRAWLETWITMPETPESFRETAGWHFFFMKQQDGREHFTYQDLPRMAEAAKAVGMPYLLLFGWHKPGHDNNYAYQYLPSERWGGEKGLREAIAKVREMGVRLLPFYNGTLANPATSEHQQYGHEWEARTRAGHPYYAGNWSHHGGDLPGRDRERIHHELCPCDGMRANFINDARRIVHDYGFGGIHLDQGADKMWPCYNDAHGHSRPDRACVDGFGELLPRTRAIVREADPDGVMIVECMNDFAGQWADGAWSWSMLEFPEPILYSLPWILFSSELDALEYKEANTCFAYKINMDLRINGGYECVTEYPEFADHLRRLGDLRRRIKPYYVHGRFRDREGLDAVIPEGVLATVYRASGDQAACVVLAETAGRDVSLSMNISLPVAPRATWYSVFGEEEKVDVTGTVTASLRPYEVRALCLDRATPGQ